MHFATRKQSIYIMATLLIVCPLFRLFAPYFMTNLGVPAEKHSFYLYLLTFTYIDGFACGALAASISAKHLQNANRWFFASFIALLATGLFNYWHNVHSLIGFSKTLGLPGTLPTNYQYVYGYSLIFITTSACILAVQKNIVLANIFSIRPLVFLGKISYGLYVYHIAVRTFLQHSYPGFIHTNMGLFLFLCVSIIIAWISFRYIEQPFLSLKQKFSSDSKVPDTRQATTNAI